MKKQLFAILAWAAFVTTTPAAVYTWLGYGTAYDWTDGVNWFDINAATTGTVPGPADHALLGQPDWGQHRATWPWPVISTDVGTVGTFGMDWWPDTSGLEGDPQLEIATGGALWATSANMNVSAGAAETATINITGGTMNVGNWDMSGGLNMAVQAGGTSQINIDAGFLFVISNLSFGAGTSNIDIEPGGTLFFYLDRTTDVAGWIGDGYITGGDGSLPLEYFYNPDSSLTTVIAVPEPSAAFMLLLIPLALVRRRRR